jgi:hypothetical protein
MLEIQLQSMMDYYNNPSCNVSPRAARNDVNALIRHIETLNAKIKDLEFSLSNG